MTAKYIEKDQIWQHETTRYWFQVEDHEYLENGLYGINDCNGEISYVDCDGAPVDQGKIIFLEKELILIDEIIND